MSNPYIVGNPVQGQQFLNRKRELRKVVSRIISGQSVALVADPRQGKTSLLMHVMAPENRQTLFGALTDKFLLFYYLDVQTIGEDLNQQDLWSQIFDHFKQELASNKSKAELAKAYKTCKKDGFTTFNLERLIANLDPAGYRLVLVIDEFDTILYHKGLDKAEFYGGLRSLAQRYGSALTLVIATNISTSKLNEATQEYSRTGSPYFNFLTDVVLEPFSQKVIDELLECGGEKFSGSERKFIQGLAWGHPYFLGVAASAMCEAYEEGLKPKERLEYAGKELFRSAEQILSSTWNLWSPEARKAFVIIALDEMPGLLNGHQLDFNELRKILDDYSPELRYLEERGFIFKDAELPTGWSVGAKIMLWWLADILVIALRQNNDLGQFIRQQQWDGMFSEKEKAQFRKSVGYIATLAKSGVETFVKAAAEGFGKAFAPK